MKLETREQQHRFRIVHDFMLRHQMITGQIATVEDLNFFADAIPLPEIELLHADILAFWDKVKDSE